MDDLFVRSLQDIYYAGQQLLKALPKMAGNANPELKNGLLVYLKQIKTDVQRLEQLVGLLDEAVDRRAVHRFTWAAGEVEDKVMLVATLINVAGAAGHYEINRYGSLAAWARQLGRADCAQILAQTLEEEKQTDRKLTQLPESKINQQAA